MAKEVKVTSKWYDAHYEAINNNGHSDPLELRAMRKQAFDVFKQLGFPTSADEDWKYTDLKVLGRTKFDIAKDLTEDALPAAAVDSFKIPNLDAHTLVFLNGKYAPWLSNTQEISDKIYIASLANVLSSGEKKQKDLVLSHFGKLAEFGGDALAALNTAFVQDGAVVLISKGAVIDKPVYVLFLTTGKGQSTATYPRLFFLAEEHSEAVIVEDYRSSEVEQHFTGAISEISLLGNAKVSYYKVGEESAGALHVGKLFVSQKKASVFNAFSLSLGGALVRNEIQVAMTEAGCETTLNGLSVLGDGQHVDNHTVLDHMAPHCESVELYKGVYAGNARGVFSGTVIVQPDAQKTNAIQSNHSLLLSPDAHIDSRPQLKIWADDVKCTHGATVGQLDENALFYIRSRGVPKAEAKNMLIQAFLGEALQDVKVAALREYFQSRLLEKLGSI
ncbi:Fe-S cluster assembly protein SufD [Oligoflexia bacterium]|nr:Fe-S cluster assembly protein SufD [Oligoflexia bacterium]